MSLTLATLRLHAQHACAIDSTTLPPGTSSEAAADQIINQAGGLLYAHQWKFRESDETFLVFNAPITVSNGTWTQSTLTLTKTGGFTNYTHADGNIIRITDGTGATAGYYPIASRTSNDAIVLGRTIGSAADGLTDIDGTISFPYAEVPSDFEELLGHTFVGTSGSLHLTTIQKVIELRYNRTSATGNRWIGAFVRPGRAAVTSALPNVRLEFDHAPTAYVPDAMAITYRRKWAALTGATNVAAIPDNNIFETLLIEYVRAVAEGYMVRHGENGTGFSVIDMTDRINQLESGPLFSNAANMDGLTQPHYGAVQNTAVAMSRVQVHDFDYAGSSVSTP